MFKQFTLRLIYQRAVPLSGLQLVMSIALTHSVHPLLFTLSADVSGQANAMELFCFDASVKRVERTQNIVESCAPCWRQCTHHSV